MLTTWSFFCKKCVKGLIENKKGAVAGNNLLKFLTGSVNNGVGYGPEILYRSSLLPYLPLSERNLQIEVIWPSFQN